IGKPERVDEHTLFAIGSNTKAFTAAGVGLLVQEGKLSWDAPVREYLPFFALRDPLASEMMTVRDLLCHRCGLGTWAGDLLLLGNYSSEEVVRRVRHIEPAYPFRAGYGYCNLMFITAGLLTEAVSGMGWDDFVRERLFLPLGINESVTSPRLFDERTNIAAPHEDIEGKVQRVSYHADAGVGSAGSICASAAEMARWLRMQLRGGRLDGRQIVDGSIIEETHKPHTLIPIRPLVHRLFPTRHFYAYGLGWFMNDHNGRLVIHHTGGVNGMLSCTMFLPEEDLGVVVLTNKLPNRAYIALPYFIVDTLTGQAGRDWFQAYEEFERADRLPWEQARQQMLASRAQGTHTSLPLEAFAGQYDSPIAGGAQVEERDGGLHLQLRAHPSLGGPLTHWHYDAFTCKWDEPVLAESLVTFTTDGQGRVANFRVKVREDWIDPVEHVFTRIGPAADRPLSPSD
ncbi:MAG TPA: serine hydrolase, partial [Anaerolineales bacterium]